MKDDIAHLTELCTKLPPAASKDQWLQMKDMIAYFIANAESDDFVTYARVANLILNSAFVPNRALSPIDEADLLLWDSDPFSTWSYSEGGRPPQCEVCHPLEHCGSKTLRQGEPVLFGRDFDGRVGDKTYFELNQKFAQICDIHLMPERNAYCALDENGDVEDAVSIRKIKLPGHTETGTVVLLKRKHLDEYLRIADCSVVRTFDCMRFTKEFFGWNGSDPTKISVIPTLFYYFHLEGNHASFARGCQHVTRRTAALKPKKMHESFIAYDWKSKQVIEISCSPGQTSNYFTKSDLPYELSPAFFRPEVLARYKTDKDKYTLEDRSVRCRGTWSLETYDINEAGQVHTYIACLRNLPYTEQLHWKAHNEPPKGSISKRAFMCDFKGEWHEEYDPLPSLKNALTEIRARLAPWWSLRCETLLERVNYPVTASADEWAEEILGLDQLLVEGFEEKWLRKKSEELGRTPDDKLRSLKLIHECLIGLNYEPDHAKTIVTPLAELHDLRSKVKGHAQGSEAAALLKSVQAKHGSYKKHFKDLAARCDESLRAIAKALG